MIQVTDTRTWSRGGAAEAFPDADRDERQLLVGDDRPDDHENEARSRSQSLDEERDNVPRLGVMGNPAAQLSRIDVHTSNDHLNGGDIQDNVSGGGLTAKAGIILVRLYRARMQPY